MNIEFMKEALLEAKLAFQEDEVPIGAVLVKDNKVIYRSHNFKQQLNNPLKHAELNLIEEAIKDSGNKYLNEYDLYVTLEPCLMCAGAIINSRIKNIYIGTLDPKGGFLISNLDVRNSLGVHHKMNIEHGILEEDCAKILRDFFKIKRNK